MKAIVDYAYTINEFSGGLVSAVDETLIKKNCAKSLSNITVRSGVLKNCNGIKKYFSTYIPTSVVDTILWIEPLFDSQYAGQWFWIVGKLNGVKVLLRWDAETGNCYLQDSTLINANYAYGSVQFENTSGDKVLIFGNGYSNTLIANVDTVSKLKMNGSSSAASDSNVAPKGRFFALHHDRIWTAGNNNNASSDLVSFSTSNEDGIDAQDWTIPTSETEANQHGGAIQVYSYDGGEITGLEVIFDDIVIFKTCNIFKITGSTPEDYQLSQVYSAKGTIVGKTIANAGDHAYFLSDDGIYVYNGVSVELISSNVTDIIKNYFDEDYACATYHDSKYILCLDGSIILEYDEITKSFTKRVVSGNTITGFVNFRNDLLVTIEEDVNLYQYDSSNLYRNSAYYSYWQSGTTDLNYPDAKKAITAMYVNCSCSGMLTFSIITENGTKSKTITPGTTTKINKVKLKNKGRQFSVKVQSSSGSTFEIKSIKLLIDIDPD